MSKPALILGLGAAALFLMRKGDGAASTVPYATGGLEPEPEPEADTESGEGAVSFGSHGAGHTSDCLDEWLSPEGKPRVGHLYQVVDGDDPIVVARRALFGSSEPRVDAAERQAVIDLSIRIDCGPWNQTVNSRPKCDLKEGHHAVDRGYTQKGICYARVFPDNAARLRDGKSPMVGDGESYPLIWIPRIDLEKFSRTFEVTTLGQDWPDDGDGAYSMIDPPPWVIDLEFVGEIKVDSVGCHLPEGDFRRSFESGE